MPTNEESKRKRLKLKEMKKNNIFKDKIEKIYHIREELRLRNIKISKDTLKAYLVGKLSHIKGEILAQKKGGLSLREIFTYNQEYFNRFRTNDDKYTDFSLKKIEFQEIISKKG